MSMYGNQLKNLLFYYRVVSYTNYIIYGTPNLIITIIINYPLLSHYYNFDILGINNDPIMTIN